jgi:hypothetical protein
MTAWLHMKPLKPINRPLATADTTQMARCIDSWMAFPVSMDPTRKLLTLETIRATMPDEKAAATAEDTATRQAMLEKGRRTVNSQV